MVGISFSVNILRSQNIETQLYIWGNRTEELGYQLTQDLHQWKNNDPPSHFLKSLTSIAMHPLSVSVMAEIQNRLKAMFKRGGDDVSSWWSELHQAYKIGHIS